jgi:hypothetical protein
MPCTRSEEHSEAGVGSCRGLQPQPRDATNTGRTGNPQRAEKQGKNTHFQLLVVAYEWLSSRVTGSANHIRTPGQSKNVQTIRTLQQLTSRSQDRSLAPRAASGNPTRLAVSALQIPLWTTLDCILLPWSASRPSGVQTTNFHHS